MATDTKQSSPQLNVKLNKEDRKNLLLCKKLMLAEGVPEHRVTNPEVARWAMAKVAKGGK